MVKKIASARSIGVTAGDIAGRAYAMYVERGRADGFDREDWLRAERELKAAPGIASRKRSTGVNTARHRQL